ncbi:MAG: RNA methyltransferase [Microbacteriaceae bacterium]
MPIIEINELADPRLVDYSHQTDVALRKTTGNIGQDPGIYLAESALVLERALRAGHQPRSVLALGDSVDQAKELLREHPHVPIFVGPAELLAELTGYLLHRGLVASLDRPILIPPAELLSQAQTVVVLSNVVDPTNVGAIFRSVAAIGADAVLVTPDTSDPLYRRSIRVAMGSVFQVPWTRLPHWPEGGQILKDHGFNRVALALSEDAIRLQDFRPEGKTALILGGEGYGLGDAVLQDTDVRVMIPMRGGIDSLNVAAASAVAIWSVLNG